MAEGGSRFWDFEATLWRWQSDGGTAWVFVTLPHEVADEIEDLLPPVRGGFGSVRVEVWCHQVHWKTSLFPSTKHESFILPIKADVRRRAGVDVGDETCFELRLEGIDV